MINLSYHPPKPPILIANQLQSQFHTINKPIIRSHSIIKKKAMLSCANSTLTCADRLLTCAGGKLTCADGTTPFPRGRLTSPTFSPVVLTCAGGVPTCARGLLVVIFVFLGLWVLPFRKRGGGVTAVLGGLPERRAVRESAAAEERREIAIRRVREEEEEGGESVVDFLIFGTSREKGDTLFIRIWTPVSIKVRGLVVLLHGLNEHSGRYSDFAKQLNANGYKVYGMDWIGHGGSDGLHAYVHSLDCAVMDLKSFIEKVLGENPGLPCFCYGHSTGGAIILKAALDPVLENKIAGIVITSPAIGVQPSHSIFSVLAPVFSLLIPKYQFSAANKKGMRVSRDPDALLAKYSDPLVYTGSIRVRTGYEILRIASYLQQNLKQIKVPFLVLHGSADTVTDPEASQKLYKEASSTDKSIKLYPGLLHDLLFEPEREEIVNGIIEWLNNRMQGKALHEV